MLVMVIVTGNVTATMVTMAESTLLNHDRAVARMAYVTVFTFCRFRSS
jgi:uncharacterized membrane protein